VRRRLALIAIALLTSSCAALAPHAANAPPRTPTATKLATADAIPRANGTPHLSRPTERAARRAATRFLTSYLRLTYGHATRNREVRELVGAPPRVPAAVRRLHPRVVRLELTWTGPTRVSVLATIDDGRAHYPVAILLTRQASGFRVVALEP
jgi:hypothetical protein